jgi:hypothetical protein
MKPLPKIKSIGPPPERHAERMAIEFARWLVAEERRRVPLWDEVFKNANDGNQKGQIKMVERLAKVSGNSLLSVDLQPGNRRKYRMILQLMVGWDNGDLIADDAPIPPAPWLALIMELVHATYSTTKHRRLVLALISQHAIARLAERCGARDPHDITRIAQDMSMAIIKLNKTADRNKMPEGGWRAPFKGGIAVLRVDDATGYPLVTTVLPPDECVRTRTEIA